VRLNPNTKTAPLFRAQADAELTAQIYSRVPVLIEDGKGTTGNPWGMSFMTMFHMANDSGLFRTAIQLNQMGFVRHESNWQREVGIEQRQAAASLNRGDHLDFAAGAVRAPDRYVPLYEAKMIHQFDHRWATYDGTESRDVSIAEKVDPAFTITPRYWVPESEVASRLNEKNWSRDWLMGWRDITNATNERTVIATVFPRCAVGNKIPLMFTDTSHERIAALVANLSSLVLDFVARQKIGGTTLNFYLLFQFPVIPPTGYAEADLAFIVPKLLELAYTSDSMASFALDMNYDGPPFIWDEDRRAHLRADLDAWYALAYGLSRDELRYVLDPKDVMGADYPSETFRVLQKNEIAKYGEYRTARLVLAAYDRLVSEGMRPRTEGYR
jgi:hypothetical protein